MYLNNCTVRFYLEPRNTRDLSRGLPLSSSPDSSFWLLIEMARSQMPTSLGIAISENIEKLAKKYLQGTDNKLLYTVYLNLIYIYSNNR